MVKKSIFWFRRDIRLSDNAGLYHALKSGNSVQPIFIFDKNILSKLPSKKDARVTFIHEQITQLSESLVKLGSSLKVFYGKPETIWKKILNEDSYSSIYFNEDYESYARERDDQVLRLAEAKGVRFLRFKDQIIFDGKEVLKDDGNPYVVFTPYKRKWLAKLESKEMDSELFYLKSYPTEKYFDRFIKSQQDEIVSLKKMGFTRSDDEIPSATVSQKIIKNYTVDRDYPALNGTSRLGIHFRFGTISIRQKAKKRGY